MSTLRPGLSLVESTAERLRLDLLSSLRTESLSPGNRILSERQLAQKFDVSYMTARRAVDRLVSEGLLIRRERQGVFVAKTSNRGDDARSLTRVRGLFYLGLMEFGYILLRESPGIALMAMYFIVAPPVMAVTGVNSPVYTSTGTFSYSAVRP